MVYEAKKMSGLLRKLPEKEYTCPVHGKYFGAPFMFGQTLVETSCPECEKMRAAEKAKEQARENFGRRCYISGIPPRFFDEDFDTFDAYTPELEIYLEASKRFAQSPKGHNIIMLGNNGNGKTHLACAIIKKTGGKIQTAQKIVQCFKDVFDGHGSESRIYSDLSKTPVLVIDEVEKMKGSEFNHNWMSEIIGRRYNNYLPTILIGNLHLKADCGAEQKPCPDCLEAHLTNDVLSRLIGATSALFKFHAPDYRLKKTERVASNG
jgi:DNA replication protein DnaC